MGALAEAAFHPCPQRNARLSEFVAQPVRRREHAFPFFAAAFSQQAGLHKFSKGRCMDTKEPYFRAFAPVRMKQAVYFAVDFIVQLRWYFERMRARNSCEVLVAKL